MEKTTDNAIGFKTYEVTLENIFKCIIEADQEVAVSLNVMKKLIISDLNLKYNHLDEDKVSALPYMLMRYIKNWPGWSRKQEYDNGSLDLEAWRLRFRNYICYKMQLLVTKTLPNYEADSTNNSVSSTKKFVDVGTQSEDQKCVSNFSIDVSGPAILLNNLVFSGNKGDINVEQHADRPWVDLECVDLLNYPYVEVEFNSSELSFKRSCDPKVSMHLGSKSDFNVDETNFILGQNSINSTGLNGPIKLSILEAYIKAFKSAVFSQYQMSVDQQDEFSAVLDQFYLDMVDISSENSVYDNKRITFNIGRNVYKRTKKIFNGKSPPAVLFNEVILPRVISSFRHFTATQHDDKKDMFKPVISYKCTFCKIVFDGTDAKSKILEHIKHLHTRAQTLLCLRCNKCMELDELSRRRWKCVCKTES